MVLVQTQELSVSDRRIVVFFFCQFNSANHLQMLLIEQKCGTARRILINFLSEINITFRRTERVLATTEMHYIKTVKQIDLTCKTQTKRIEMLSIIGHHSARL